MNKRIGITALFSVATVLLCASATGCHSRSQSSDDSSPIRMATPEPAPDVSPAEQTRQFRAAYVQGVRHVERGQYGQALASFEEALRAQPNSQAALFNLGACYEAIGDPLRAIGIYRQCIATTPNDPDAYANLGTSFIKMYYREKSPAWRTMAHDAWKRSLELNPKQPRVRAYLAAKESLD
jgi:tetratricopeptide (TPR) repeat protein